MRELVQQLRDELEQMGELVRQIDRSHLRYRKRAVQRAQFLLLSDRSARATPPPCCGLYARDIHTQEDLWEPDDSPLARRVQLWPASVFGADPLYPPAAQRTPAPLEPVADSSCGPRAAGQRAAAFAGLRPLCCYRGERGRFGTPGTGRPAGGGRQRPGKPR